MEIIIYLSLVFILISIGFYWLFKQADKFFREAERIEELIKNGENAEEAFAALLKLNKDSFHRQTASRIRELGKMIEVKYNIEIFRK